VPPAANLGGETHEVAAPPPSSRFRARVPASEEGTPPPAPPQGSGSAE
jgi:hypothetical protein